MDQSIFRDVALERLSVPDGLDRLAPALVWVYIRRIPLVVSGQA